MSSVLNVGRRLRPRRTQRARPAVLAIALALSSAWLYRTWTARSHAAPAPGTTVPLAEVSTPSPGPVAAVNAASHEWHYRERIRELYATAVREGCVCYDDVLRAAYDPGIVTPQVLARKSAYRKRMRLRADFLSDYRLSAELTKMQEGRAVYDPLDGGWLRGLHAGDENLIVVGRGSNPAILCHEAGHALQRNSVFDPANVSHQITFAAYRAGRLTDAAERRLRYLASQRELEVSLQDLNRFHAFVFRGRPIMDARETITALHALGMLLTYERVQPMLEAPQRPLTSADFHNRLRRPPDAKAGDHYGWRSMFPDAFRLHELRKLALEADPTLWPPQLKKILLEAPGHL